MSFRDQFFSALRGKATFESKKLGGSSDVELAVHSDGRVRMEFTGPLGIRLALLLINEEWVYLFVPRENSVIRFPKSELFKDTIRRERFLEMLPFPVVPEAFFQGLLTQVGGIPKTGVPVGATCEVDEDARAYRLRFLGNSLSASGGRFVWVDGVDYYPLRVVYFERSLPVKWSEGALRPTFDLIYSKFSGEGAATLPKHFDLKMGTDTEPVLSFWWSSAELWENPNKSVFDWRPAASMNVRDY